MSPLLPVPDMARGAPCGISIRNLQLTPELERPKIMHKLTVLAPMATALIALLALAHFFLQLWSK